MDRPAILIAVDFSPGSRLALEAGREVARRLGATAILLHAGHHADVGGKGGGYREQHERTAQAWARELAEAGIKTEVAMHEGLPADVILAEAQRRGVAMVVVGTSGAGGFKGWLLGSVAREMLRRSRVPLLVAPERMMRATQATPRAASAGGVPDGPIVAAIDLASPHVFDAALGLARDMKLPLRLVHVLDLLPYTAGGVPVQALHDDEESALGQLALLATRARDAGVEAWPVVHHGHAATAVLADARACAASMVVAGTHGASRAVRFILGSVAQSIVQAADRPVLVVPEPKGPERGEGWR